MSVPKWLASYRPIKGILCDITGVLYESGATRAIDGSVEAISRLKEAGIAIRFLTNETQRTRRSLVEKLRGMGYGVEEKEVIAPAPITCQTLISRSLKPFLLVHPDVLTDFEACDTGSPNCVVVGDAAEHFTYENMNIAFKILLDNPVLISMGKGKYYKEKGELVLDLGAFAAALEYACDIKADVIGKPSKEYFHTALNELGLTSDQVFMIGDDIASDVAAAQKCGLRGLLVRTGKYRESDEHHPTIRPDAIVDNLAEAVQQLLLHKE